MMTPGGMGGSKMGGNRDRIRAPEGKGMVRTRKGGSEKSRDQNRNRSPEGKGMVLFGVGAIVCGGGPEGNGWARKSPEGD